MLCHGGWLAMVHTEICLEYLLLWLLWNVIVVMECYGMLWNVLECYGMLCIVMVVFDCCGMFWLLWNVIVVMECYGMLWNVVECSGMLWNVMYCDGCF